MPDEDKNFSGSLGLDFRKWWRHVKTFYRQSFTESAGSISVEWPWIIESNQRSEKFLPWKFKIGLLQQTITWCKIRHLNWYMVSEFLKQLSKALQSLKGMVTSSWFTPLPFYWLNSKIIFAMCAISMSIAVS